MRVKIENIFLDDYLVKIVNQRYVERIRCYLHQFKGLNHANDGLTWPFHGGIYLRSPGFDTLRDLFGITKVEYNKLENYYPVSKNADNWIVLSCVGYNAADDCKL